MTLECVNCPEDIIYYKGRWFHINQIREALPEMEYCMTIKCGTPNLECRCDEPFPDINQINIDETMAKPISKYDKCSYCGHSQALDHKHSWNTTTCDSCPDRKGCNEKNGWGTGTK